MRSADSALDVVQTLSQLIGVAAVGGLSEAGIGKFIQKSGLDRVFDSLRKEKSFQDYMQQQGMQREMSSITITQVVDYGISHFNENSNLGVLIYEMIHKEEELNLVKLLELDGKARQYFNDGLFDHGFYSNFTEWSSETLRENFNKLLNQQPPTGSSDFNFGLDASGLRYNPIGAFYDSRAEATDNASSIAGKTLTLFDNRQQGLTANQLAAQDTNADGQLSGAELINISAWSDLNENGQVDADEMKSLAQRGITRIRSSDFEFFTRGNTRLAGSEVSEAGIVSGNRSTPDSNFRYLRDHNPVFELPEGHIYWNPNMVKINCRKLELHLSI